MSPEIQVPFTKGLEEEFWQQIGFKGRISGRLRASNSKDSWILSEIKYEPVGRTDQTTQEAWNEGGAKTEEVQRESGAEKWDHPRGSNPSWYSDKDW